MTETVISAQCDYPSAFAAIGGHQIHYLEDGQGIPLVFVHGIGTYSYMWRNIIPHVNKCCRCIAPDMLGFGLSDKPDIQYDLATYQTMFAEFIDSLQLDEIILVLHGFGSVIGFDYAMKNSSKVKGLVFMESHIRPTTDVNDVSLPVQEIIMMANNNQKDMQSKILQENFYIEKILPASIMRNLTDEEMNHYRKPFPTPESRKAILDFMQLSPYLQQDDTVMECISKYSEKLVKSQIPKLMLYALPGFISTMSTVHWAKEHLSNVKLVDIGEALHIPQESQPASIGRSMREWFNDTY